MEYSLPTTYHTDSLQNGSKGSAILGLDTNNPTKKGWIIQNPSLKSTQTQAMLIKMGIPRNESFQKNMFLLPPPRILGGGWTNPFEKY